MKGVFLMNLKKFLKAALCGAMVVAMAVTAGCGGGDKKAAEPEKVLRVGTEPTFAPFEFQKEGSKSYDGFDMDLARAIGKQMGYKVEMVSMGFDALIPALNSNNIDVAIAGMTITDERKEKYDFSTPYIYTRPVLIVAADNTDITSFEDVNGKKAAEGLTSNFNEIAKSYGAEIVGQDKFALAMECVLSGEADCAINDELTYAYWKQQKGGDESTKIVAESDDVNASAVMLKKGNDELVEKINTAIDALIADGTVKEISEKYFGLDVSQP